MPTNLDQIAQHLKDSNLLFEADPDGGFVYIGFTTRLYCDDDNQSNIRLAIHVAEAGEFLFVIAPRLYICNSRRHYPAVREAICLALSRFKMVRFELDDSDGEIRAAIHLPLGGSPLDRRQLCRVLEALVEIVESCDEMFREAIANGEVIPPDDPAEMQRAFQDFLVRWRASRRRRQPVALED